MTIREMEIEDIPQVLEVRNSVNENRLDDPSSIGIEDCKNFLEDNGQGWVLQDGKLIIGFAMLNNNNNVVWALFVRPEYEGKGIGKALHKKMLESHFSKSKSTLYLGTSPKTRAEKFYRSQGWSDCGKYDNGELKFQFDHKMWLFKKSNGK